jgi:hypothetical protein
MRIMYGTSSTALTGWLHPSRHHLYRGNKKEFYITFAISLEKKTLV